MVTMALLIGAHAYGSLVARQASVPNEGAMCTCIFLLIVHHVLHWSELATCVVQGMAEGCFLVLGIAR